MAIYCMLRLQTTDEGGRLSPIQSGYRPSFRLPNAMDHSASVWFGQDIVNPGETLMVELKPMVSPYWKNVRFGDYLEMYEGCRLVGKAIVMGVNETDTSIL